MIKKSYLLLLIPLMISCSPPAPEDLAKETCDCYTKAKSHNNSDNQIEETDNCFGIGQRNEGIMKDIEHDEDMNETQVSQFEARYDKVFNQCK